MAKKKKKREKLAKDFKEIKSKLIKVFAKANFKITKLEIETQDFKAQISNLIQNKVLEILTGDKLKKEGNKF